MDKNDPYLSELDAIEDMDEPMEGDTGKTEIHDVSVTQKHVAFGGEEPTRIDHRVVTAKEGGEDEFFSEQFPEQEEGEGGAPGQEGEPESYDEVSEGSEESGDILDLAPDMNVPLVIVMGRKSYTVKDLLGLRMGQVLDLDRPPLDPVDLVAAGRVIGKGELVEVEGNLGVRILKLFK